MSFWGYLISIIGIGICLYGGYVMFRDLIYPLYEEIFLQKRYEQDTFDKVRWIAIKNHLGSIESHHSYKTIRDKELYEYILELQYNLNLEEYFCLDFSNEKEKDFICEILDTHKNSVVTSLFYNSLKKHKDIYKLDFLEYYLFSLWEFLSNKQEKNEEFKDKVLWKFFSRDGSYTTYKFTDYGVIYQKLFYIATLFCVNNEKTKILLTDSQHTLNGVKKNLENKEITFYTYRP